MYEGSYKFEHDGIVYGLSEFENQFTSCAKCQDILGGNVTGWQCVCKACDGKDYDDNKEIQETVNDWYDGAVTTEELEKILNRWKPESDPKFIEGAKLIKVDVDFDNLSFLDAVEAVVEQLEKEDRK